VPNLGKENAVSAAAALAAKSGKSNDNAKDQSFQIVRLNDQIAALKRQVNDHEQSNKANEELLKKYSEVNSRRFGSMLVSVLSSSSPPLSSRLTVTRVPIRASAHDTVSTSFRVFRPLRISNGSIACLASFLIDRTLASCNRR
jgi:hypothetical protein